MTSSAASHQPRRFYKVVSVGAAESGYGICLDARPLRTPAGAELSMPTRASAEAIAAEWQRQGARLDIAGMSLTRLANVAIDRAPGTRSALAEEVARYCGTDLVCHLAEHPADLVAQQEAGWAPVRRWAGETLGIRLVPATGIQAAAQPEASLEAARRHALGLDDFRLTGLARALGLYGSALLALAVEQTYLSAMAAFDLSRIDEDYQAGRWGVDEEALAVIEAERQEVAALEVWFETLADRGTK